MDSSKTYQTLTCTDIEVIVASHWGYRRNIIVPNVSWGLGLHECDLLIVSKSNYATEVEIKISRSDLKKDQSKGHGHKSKRIKYLYFAIPEKLETCIDLIPAHAGVIIIRHKPAETNMFGYTSQPHTYIDIVREPQPNKDAVKLSDKEMMKLTRLGCMRIWALKQTVTNLSKDNKYLRTQNLTNASS